VPVIVTFVPVKFIALAVPDKNKFLQALVPVIPKSTAAFVNGEKGFVENTPAATSVSAELANVVGVSNTGILFTVPV